MENGFLTLCTDYVIAQSRLINRIDFVHTCFLIVIQVRIYSVCPPPTVFYAPGYELYVPRSRWPDRSDPWSDEFRAHTCSRCARITWSEKGFERTFVWTMVWNLPDQRPLCSGTVWSEVTLVWNGLIRGSFKRTQVWSEADSSAH